MKSIAILIFIALNLSSEDSNLSKNSLKDAESENFPIISEEKLSQPQRELTQIRVEEEKKPKIKSDQSPKVQKKLKDNNTIYLKKIDGIIKNFGLDKKLQKKKVANYFKKLEDKIYNSLRRSLFKQRKYMQSYQGVIRHYKDISEKYNIN